MDVADKGQLDGGRLWQIEIELAQDVTGRRSPVGNVGKDLDVERHHQVWSCILNQMTRGYVTIEPWQAV